MGPQRYRSHLIAKSTPLCWPADLVERSRDFFVAYGQLKSGLEKLAAAGIEAVAVAGNHDVHVLPRLAAELDHLHLLGAGGQWESRDLGDITLIGWSFPTAQVRSSPLDQFPAGRPGKPRIGLLHCDRDQADSAYAPGHQPRSRGCRNLGLAARPHSSAGRPRHKIDRSAIWARSARFVPTKSGPAVHG